MNNVTCKKSLLSRKLAFMIVAVLFGLGLTLGLAFTPRRTAARAVDYFEEGADGIYTATADSFRTDGTKLLGLKPEAILALDTIDAFRISIPDGMTEIGDNAFAGRMKLVSVELPASVTTIGASAFARCSRLHEINDLSNVATIGMSAFAESGITEITVNAAVIGADAFKNCFDLYRVEIGSEVRLTGASAEDGPFAGCVRLLEVNDQRAETSQNYWTYAVDTASESTSITKDSDNFVYRVIDGTRYLIDYIGTTARLFLPEASEGAEYQIYNWALSHKTFLLSVDVPWHVTNIGEHAFSDSVNLRRFTVGSIDYSGGVENEIVSNLANLGDEILKGCDNLREVYNYSEKVTFVNPEESDAPTSGAATNGTTYTLYRRIDYVYNKNDGTEPRESNFRIVGDYVFYITFVPDSRTIATASLEGYTGSATTLQLPTTITTAYNEEITAYAISNGAFRGNLRLREIIIADNVTAIGMNAFRQCESLESVLFEDALKLTAGRESKLSSVGEGAFAECTALLGIRLPNSVKTVGARAFEGDVSLVNVTLSSSLNSWGGDAGFVFAGCTALRSIVIPADVTIIPQHSFDGCTALTSVTFSAVDKLETVGDYAFANSGITDIVLPAAVTSIGASAFDGCAVLTYVTFAGDKPAAATTLTIGTHAFRDTGLVGVNLRNTANTLTIGEDAFAGTQNSFRTVFISDGIEIETLKTLLTRSDANFFDCAIVMETHDEYQTVYNALSADTEFMADHSAILNHFYHAETITFKVNDASTQELKLVSKTGASIKFVRRTIKCNQLTELQPYYWLIDESYTLPTSVGGYTVAADRWTMVPENLTTDNVGSASFSITIDNIVPLPQNVTVTYDGTDWKENNANFIDNDNYVLQFVDNESGAHVGAAIDAGTYTVYVLPKEGYTWPDGTKVNKSFILTISPIEAELTWYLNDVALKSKLPEIVYTEKVNRIMDLYAMYNGVRYRAGTGFMSVVMYDEGVAFSEDKVMEGRPVAVVSDAGLYEFRVSVPNYIFTNATQQLLITPETIDLTDYERNLGWQILTVGTQQVNSQLRDGPVYYYGNNNYTVNEQSGLTLRNTYTATSSVVRARSAAVTIGLANSNTIDVKYDATYSGTYTATNIGRYTAQATLTAKSNYTFLVGQLSNLEARGLTITLSDDRKTATIAKVWYIVQIDNGLLDEQASIAANAPVEFTISDWTFNDDIAIDAPRLEHGDETPADKDSDWKVGNTNVEFYLYRNNTNTLVASFFRDTFTYYVNRYMPVGTYYLTARIAEVSTTDGHTHWWNEQEMHSDGNIVYHATSRTFMFTVHEKEMESAWISEITEKLNNAAFYHKYIPNQPQFYADDLQFAVLNPETEICDRGTYNFWAESKCDEYFDNKFTVTYNLSRMNNNTYFAADAFTSNSQFAPIDPDKYIVYYQFSAKNFVSLVDVHASDYEASRRQYRFDVVIYEEVPIPTVAPMSYTGDNLVPYIPANSLYEIVLPENCVDAKTYQIKLRLYNTDAYAWPGKTPADKEQEYLLDFVVTPATNDVTMAVFIIGWTYGEYSATINQPMGSSRYGTMVYTYEKQTVEGWVPIEDITTAGAGYYRLIGTVAANDNWNTVVRRVEFKIEKARNTWKTIPNIIRWNAGDYDASKNTISGAATFGTASFTVRDAYGNTVTDLSKASAGTYTLIAHVDATDNYTALHSEITFTILDGNGTNVGLIVAVVLLSVITVGLIVAILLLRKRWKPVVQTEPGRKEFAPEVRAVKQQKEKKVKSVRKSVADESAQPQNSDQAMIEVEPDDIDGDA